MNCNTKLGYFCSTHEDWVDILSADPYNLKVKRESPYVMFSYDQIRSDFNQELVREARGIIFREGDWENPVCWAFNKFGNYGESYAPDIDWSTAFVTEKVDGSLIKLWYDDDEWHISTNGAIEAYNAPLGEVKYRNFGSYFYDTVCGYYDYFDDFISGLNTSLTYMFELVGPCNRVVIPYEAPAIYFLGARNKFSGYEYFCDEELMEVLGVSNFLKPKSYPFTSLVDCVLAAEDFDWTQEGFVVVDNKFNRVKIKSPAYVLAHYTRNNNVINRKNLIRVILANETEEFLCYAEDYKDCLFECQKLMNLFINVGNQCVEICRKLTSLPRKDYAEIIKAFPKLYQGLLFCNYEQHRSVQQFTLEWSENKWDENLTKFEALMDTLSSVTGTSSSVIKNVVAAGGPV